MVMVVVVVVVVVMAVVVVVMVEVSEVPYLSFHVVKIHNNDWVEEGHGSPAGGHLKESSGGRQEEECSFVLLSYHDYCQLLMSRHTNRPLPTSRLQKHVRS